MYIYALSTSRTCALTRTDTHTHISTNFCDKTHVASHDKRTDTNTHTSTLSAFDDFVALFVAPE